MSTQQKNGKVDAGTCPICRADDCYRLGERTVACRYVCQERAGDWRRTVSGDPPRRTSTVYEFDPAEEGPPPGERAEPSGDAKLTGCQVILAYFKQRYRPVFRRGNAVRTADGRDLPMGEACVPDSVLINMLGHASDVPSFKGGAVNTNALPGFFRKWASVAWGDLLRELPDEDAAELGKDGLAGDEFRQMVKEAMQSEVVLASQVRVGPGLVETRIDKHSLIGWCAAFAKPGPWRSIRDKRCWCRLVAGAADGEQVLRVAIRHELFAQLKADRRLVAMGPNTFTRRAAKYGVGTSDRSDRPHGCSALVLDDNLVRDMISGLPDPDDEAEGPRQTDR